MIGRESHVILFDRIVKYHWASRKFETDSTAARNDQDMANGPEEDSIALARANM